MQSPTVDYSTRSDCPGTFFRCEAQRAIISTTSCSRMWKDANSRKKDPCDRLHHCQGCELGAIHSGETFIRSSELYGARICSRCHRPSSRLIHGEHCPSCYNRTREIIIGKNGKGTRPVKHATLHPCRILMECNGNVQTKQFKLTADPLEAIVSVLRHVEGAVVFGFRSDIVSTRPRQIQLELF